MLHSQHTRAYRSPLLVILRYMWRSENVVFYNFFYRRWNVFLPKLKRNLDVQGKTRLDFTCILFVNIHTIVPYKIERCYIQTDGFRENEHCFAGDNGKRNRTGCATRVSCPFGFILVNWRYASTYVRHNITLLCITLYSLKYATIHLCIWTCVRTCRRLSYNSLYLLGIYVRYHKIHRMLPIH